MQQTAITAQQEQTRNNLLSALDVRYQVSAFDGLARELNLLSLNAQIASAQIGEGGKAFSVMTGETSGISLMLVDTVKAIRDITYRWTKLIASALQDGRKLALLDRAEGYFAGKGSQRNALVEKTKAVYSQRLVHCEHQHGRLLSEMLVIIKAMEHSLRLINYVKASILIESSRLDSRLSAKSSFQYLALELQSAADRIRQIATLTLQRLNAMKQT